MKRTSITTKSFENRFLDLPVEIQEMIISKRIDLVKTFYRVSAEYQQLIEKEYFKYIWSKPTTLEELGIIKSNQPIHAIWRGKKFSEKRIGYIGITLEIAFSNRHISRLVEVIVDDAEGISVRDIA